VRSKIQVYSFYLKDHKRYLMGYMFVCRFGGMRGRCLSTISTLDVGGVGVLRSTGLGIGKLLLEYLVLVQERVGTRRTNGNRNRGSLGDHGRVTTDLLFFLLSSRAGRQRGQGAVSIIVSTDMAGLDNISRVGVITRGAIVVVALDIVDLVAADVLLQGTKDALLLGLLRRNMLGLVEVLHGDNMVGSDGVIGVGARGDGGRDDIRLVVATGASLDDDGKEALNDEQECKNSRAIENLLVKFADVGQGLAILPGVAIKNVEGVDPVAVLGATVVGLSLGRVATDRDGEHDALFVHPDRDHPDQGTCSKDHGPEETEDGPKVTTATSL
jgi:hypothetical protein